MFTESEFSLITTDIMCHVSLSTNPFGPLCYLASNIQLTHKVQIEAPVFELLENGEMTPLKGEFSQDTIDMAG